MKRWYRLSVIFANLILLAISIMPVAAAEIQDTKSATHDDGASSYQIVDVYQYPGFRVIQFNLPVLSHYSYLLISDNQALVVDPGRDVSVYIDTASKQGAKIVGVFLTHSHADFVAGHMELAKVNHCPIYVNRSSGSEY